MLWVSFDLQKNRQEMDWNGGMIVAEKLTESNFHTWKQKVELVLSFRELEDQIIKTPAPTDSEKLVKSN